MHALKVRLMPLHRVKNLANIGTVVFEFLGYKVKIVPRLGRNLTIVVHLALWCSETDWNIRISISAG